MNIKFHGKASEEADIVDLEIELISHLCTFENLYKNLQIDLTPALLLIILML